MTPPPAAAALAAILRGANLCDLDDAADYAKILVDRLAASGWQVTRADILAIEREAAAAALPDVAELTRALILTTPATKHGQLCPVWVKRNKGGGICNCFVKERAPERAAAILAEIERARG